MPQEMMPGYGLLNAKHCPNDRTVMEKQPGQFAVPGVRKDEPKPHTNLLAAMQERPSFTVNTSVFVVALYRCQKCGLVQLYDEGI